MKEKLRDTRNLYFIGGSSCCGKSTIASMLQKEYGFVYFKLDEYTGDYIEKGASLGLEPMLKISKMNYDELYLGRTVEEQVEDELNFYKESFEFFLEDLENLEGENIIIEGSNVTPDFANEYGFKLYVALVPTKKFQLDNFEKREWVQEIMGKCSNRQQAYYNLMERDIQLALEFIEQAEQNKKPYILVDGKKSIEQVYKEVKKIFKLS